MPAKRRYFPWETSPLEALQAERRQRWRERGQAQLREKLRSILPNPPAVLMVEKASCECPNCWTMICDEGIPANIVTCPYCNATFQILAWFKPRKPGKPVYSPQAINLTAIQKAQLAEWEQEGINLYEGMRYGYFMVYRAVFQCPKCAHLMMVRKQIQNSWHCTRCKRHWEVTICLQSLQLDTPSCKIVSADRQEVAPAEAISV